MRPATVPTPMPTAPTPKATNGSTDVFFVLSSGTLPVTGAAGSPINPVAIG